MANLSTNDAINKANGAAKDLTSSAKDVYNTTSHSLEKMSQAIGEKAGSTVARFSGQANEYYKTSRDYVAENPVKGIAIAAAAGLVAGSLLSMAFRRRP